MVGLQKRYAPAVQILQKHLRKEHLISYDLHYLTGAYPEGNALLDLYIHPLDLVCFLFGTPNIIACQQVVPVSYILMLRHPHIIGTLELSTSYTWTSAEESLKVCTSKGIYRLSQMDELTFEPKPSTILGIPIEKVHPHNKNIEYLYVLNNFIPVFPNNQIYSPVFPNNQIYSQGYFNELSAFVEAVEGNNANIVTSLESVRDAYLLIEKIKSH